MFSFTLEMVLLENNSGNVQERKHRTCVTEREIQEEMESDAPHGEVFQDYFLNAYLLTSL